MKYLDEYRDAESCQKLIVQIQGTCSPTWTIMEVCGGQTHGLLKFGIDEQLKGAVELIHGPGCPVCVTPLEAIDFAVELAQREGFVIATFGDMLRVPGSQQSLLDARTQGGRVKLVYSPLDAVTYAQENPNQEVVFLAVGFETTIPATALAIRQAAELQLKNFSVICSHVRVLPAMNLIAASPENRVDGFLAAGHVCSITGYSDYQQFVQRYQMPVVVTGFEPIDLLLGILGCVEQLENGQSQVTNQYGRSVLQQGNRAALEIVGEVFEISDLAWRGFGVVPSGGYTIKKKYEQMNARLRFQNDSFVPREPEECRSFEVLTGQIKPADCECFGTKCSPETPLGAPMVSSEGTCAAYYRYSRNREQAAVHE